MKKKLMVVLGVTICLLLIKIPPAQAGLARMLSMGGVFLNVTTDASAAYFSPASLAFLDKTGFSISTGSETLECIPIYIYVFNNNRIYLEGYLPASYIISYTVPDTGFGAYGLYFHSYPERVSPSGYGVTDAHKTLAYTYAKKINDNISLGGTLKVDAWDGKRFYFTKEEVNGVQTTVWHVGAYRRGLSVIDLSVLLKPIEPLSVSMLIRNANEPTVIWPAMGDDCAIKSMILREIYVGAAFQPVDFLTLAWQIDNLERVTSTGLSGRKLYDESNFGLEFVLGRFALRAGLHKRSLCYGAGLIFGNDEIKYFIDFGYGTWMINQKVDNQQMAFELSVKY